LCIFFLLQVTGFLTTGVQSEKGRKPLQISPIACLFYGGA
jgi:hypothetical protein